MTTAKCIPVVVFFANFEEKKNAKKASESIRWFIKTEVK